MFFKADALISYFFKIPFPEELSDDVWAMKWAQIQWLSDKGIINLKTD